MDDLVEIALRSVGAAIRWVLWNIIFSVILFNLGRFSLLAVTFGNYPRANVLERDFNKISTAGIVVVFVAWSVIAIYNNYEFL